MQITARQRARKIDRIQPVLQRAHLHGHGLRSEPQRIGPARQQWTGIHPDDVRCNLIGVFRRRIGRCQQRARANARGLIDLQAHPVRSASCFSSEPLHPADRHGLRGRHDNDGLARDQFAGSDGSLDLTGCCAGAHAIDPNPHRRRCSRRRQAFAQQPGEARVTRRQCHPINRPWTEPPRP